MIDLRTAMLIPTLLLAACADGGAPAQQAQRVDPVAAPTNAAATDMAPDTIDPPSTAPERTAPPTTAADTTDAAYAELLRAVVTDTGLVRYEVLAQPDHAETLKKVVAAYAAAAVPEAHHEKLALWSNAYNANVLAKVLEHRRASPGFKSVINVEGFFDRDLITVCGERLTLNDLENERVRPLEDARIHAALVCAAVSCPPLRAEPFRAATLDAQFDDQCHRWVNDPSKFSASGSNVGLSEILNWYGEDFDGPPYGSPLGFVRAFAKPGSSLHEAANAPGGTTRWLTYEWALNQAR